VTDSLQDKLEYLASVDVAPATPEANTIRAVVSALPPARNTCSSLDRSDAFVKADIIDEQHLLGRLQALSYVDLAECSDESLITTIVQRAIAELKYQVESSTRDGTYETKLRSRIASLQSRHSDDRFGGYSEEERRDVLWDAIRFTRDVITQLEWCRRLLDKAWSANDPEDDDRNPIDNVGSDIPMRVWLSDEQMRAKYGNNFSRYFAAEHPQRL
jgi:hypothetical protein